MLISLISVAVFRRLLVPVTSQDRGDGAACRNLILPAFFGSQRQRERTTKSLG